MLCDRARGRSEASWMSLLNHESQDLEPEERQGSTHHALPQRVLTLLDPNLQNCSHPSRFRKGTPFRFTKSVTEVQMPHIHPLHWKLQEGQFGVKGEHKTKTLTFRKGIETVTTSIFSCAKLLSINGMGQYSIFLSW